MLVVGKTAKDASGRENCARSLWWGRLRTILVVRKTACVAGGGEDCALCR
jgi:hypothetical protein